MCVCLFVVGGGGERSTSRRSRRGNRKAQEISTLLRYPCRGCSDSDSSVSITMMCVSSL